MLYITKSADNEILTIQVNENEVNQNILNGVSSIDSKDVDGSIKNLSTII